MIKVLFSAHITSDLSILDLTLVNAAWLKYRSPTYDIWLGVDKPVPTEHKNRLLDLGVKVFQFECPDGIDDWYTSMHSRYPCMSKFINICPGEFCFIEQDVFLINPMPIWMFKTSKPMFPRMFSCDQIGDFMIMISRDIIARTSLHIINSCVLAQLTSGLFNESIMSPRMLLEPNRKISTEELLETIDRCASNLMGFYNYENFSMPHTIDTVSKAQQCLNGWMSIHMSRWSMDKTPEDVSNYLLDYIYNGVSTIIPIERNRFNSLILGRDKDVYFEPEDSNQLSVW